MAESKKKGIAEIVIHKESKKKPYHACSSNCSFFDSSCGGFEIYTDSLQ